MAPKGKSSASSATRKKQAKKAASKAEPDQSTDPATPMLAPGAKRSKADKKAPKVKSYIPPPPPPKGEPDPVDRLGIGVGASRVSPERVISLRKLAKKDSVTTERGLEEWAEWTTSVWQDAVDKQERQAWLETIPVWIAHFPRLISHPSTKVRVLTSSILESFLLHHEARQRLCSPEDVENPAYIGSWAVALFDTDRTVKRKMESSWTLVKRQSSGNDSQESQDAGVDIDQYSPEILRHLSYLIHQLTSASQGDSDESAGKVHQVAAVGDATHGESSRKVATLSEPPHLTRARLGASAIEALAWLINSCSHPSSLLDFGLGDILSSRKLWNLVLSDSSNISSNHTSEPVVKRAVWALLSTISLQQHSALLQPNVEMLANVVVNAGFLDVNHSTAGTAIPALAAFLRQIPEAWTMSSSSTSQSKSDEGSDSSDDDNDDNDPNNAPNHFGDNNVGVVQPGGVPIALQSFLTFLSLACAGQPSLYPSTIVFLSTLPSAKRSCQAEQNTLQSKFALSDIVDPFFSSLWSAVDRRALDTVGPAKVASAYTSFCQCWVECLRWFSVNLRNSYSTESLVKNEINKMWDYYLQSVTNQSKNARRTFSSAASQALADVALTFKESYVEDWWKIFEDRSKVAMNDTESDENLALSRILAVLDILQSLDDKNTKCQIDNQSKVARTRHELLDWSLEPLLTRSGQSGTNVFVRIQIAHSLISLPRNSTSSEVNKRVDEMTAAGVLVYLCLAGNNEHLASTQQLAGKLWLAIVNRGGASAQSAWIDLFNQSRSFSDANLDFLGEAIKATRKLTQVTLPTAGLDVFLLNLLSQHTSKQMDASAVAFVSDLMRRPHPFIHTDTVTACLHIIADQFQVVIHDLLYNESTLSYQKASSSLTILYAFAEDNQGAKTISECNRASDILGSLYETHVLAPLLHNSMEEDLAILSTVEKVACVMPSSRKTQLLKRLLDRLRKYVMNTNCLSHPIDLSNAAQNIAFVFGFPTSSYDLLLDHFVPDETQMDNLLDEVWSYEPPNALIIFDRHVTFLPGQIQRQPDASSQVLSSRGNGNVYDRASIALLDVAVNYREMLKSRIWVMKHVFYLGQCAKDHIALEACNSIPLSHLKSIERITEQLITYTISSLAQDVNVQWHTSVINTLRKSSTSPTITAQVSPSDSLTRLTESSFISALQSDTVHSHRTLSRLISSILRYSDGGATEAERWLALAQGFQETNPKLTISIILGCRESLFENPRYQRFQNDIAKQLCMLPCTNGTSCNHLTLLRLLRATVPPIQTYDFLSQHRAILLIESFHPWLQTGADVIDVERLLLMFEFCTHLAAIIQSIQGEHWDPVFDAIKFVSSGRQWNASPQLYGCTTLLLHLNDLTKRNRTLNSSLSEKIRSAVSAFQPLLKDGTLSNTTLRNEPLDRIKRNVALLLGEVATPKMTLAVTLPILIHIMKSPNYTSRRLAYSTTLKLVRKHVEDLVIEAELETEDDKIYELPQELVRVISSDQDDDNLVLLAWMLLFDIFDTSSVRLRNAYNIQVRNLDLVGGRLLPLLFRRLNISGQSKPFDISCWAVDQISISLTDEDSTTGTGLSLLAAAAFFRALQTLASHVRNWHTECRNKQLSLSVTSFISHHFSPLLISRELSELRNGSDVPESLKDENLTVKVSPNVGEVKAMYVVDEQSMEIMIRIPAEYPLQSIEVLDVRKVGVSEAVWRAWLLAVQQTVTTQNGSIIEALSLFKRNIALHFEGVEACAICYSVISVTDRSLPRKACRTCHNKFHPSCLYKWFSTSHGSSCPLCRSLF